jgi:hypothetical protein
MRTPSATVAFKLRMKETERSQLEAAAQRNRVSMNNEIRARLAQSFRSTGAYEATQAAIDVRRILGPMLGALHELAEAGALIQATDSVVACAQSGAPMDAALARYREVKTMIEHGANILSPMVEKGSQL